MESVIVSLERDMFCRNERALLVFGGTQVSLFRYAGSVEGLRVKNRESEWILLPYQGQQIWRAFYHGQNMTMTGMFEEPLPDQRLLHNYGAFLLHCGATGMGVPGPGDTHLHHGELPNIPYETAYVRTGEDTTGRYVAIGGSVCYRVGFTVGYRAEPEFLLHENNAVANLSMTLTNLRKSPMEYMYLTHMNFRPVDGARLMDTAPRDSRHVFVHRSAPDALSPAKRESLFEYMDRISADPACHDLIDSDRQVYDPEIVMTLRYLADRDGFAHCMQLLPDGNACYAAFQPQNQPYGLRWISRTADEQALGMVLPATAEHLGYTYAKANGQVRSLPGNGSIRFSMRAGFLNAEQAVSLKDTIARCLDGAASETKESD